MVRHHLLSDGHPEWSYYGKSDGLGTYEMSGGHLGAVMKTSDGRLWFGTTYGLAVVDPANLVNESVPPKPVIEKLVVDGVLMNGMAQEMRGAQWRGLEQHAPDTTKIWDDDVSVEGLGLAPVMCRSSNHRYEFHIGALQFSHPQSVSFRYRILGFDEAWHEIGKQRVIHIYDLPPGDYDFELQARSVLPLWSEDTALIALMVTPQIWETTSFQWTFFCLTAGGVMWLGRYLSQRRLRVQLEKTSEQKRLFEDRSRIPETLHDDLGANLTQMALLSDASRREKALPETTQAHIRRVASLARESIRRLDEIVWAINPANDHLQQLLDYLCSYADEFFEHSDTKVRFELPDQLDAFRWPSRSRLEIFLAFKECLNNVAKSAEATLVTIQLEQSNKGWLLRIRDNGKGIVSDNESRGHGLKNMRKRLERIGGGCQVKSALGKGTTVTFALPEPGGIGEVKS
jgi:signal transduction histidine kinase